MDLDPELDVTLSDGRRVANFQIAAVHGATAWTLVEPGALRRVVGERAVALATRRRLDRRIAVRLAAGWVPLDAGLPLVPPTPVLSRDWIDQPGAGKRPNHNITSRS